MGRRLFTIIAAACWLILSAGCSQLTENPPQPFDEKCDACHELPPSDSVHLHVSAPPEGMPAFTCDKCHNGYNTDKGWTKLEKHRNGIIDTMTTECDFCHDYHDCNDCHDAPPKDGQINIEGEKSARIHKIHDTSHIYIADSSPDSTVWFTCNQCHAGYELDNINLPRETHDNGVIDVNFDIYRKPQYSGPGYTPIFRNDSCINIYCHAATTKGGKPGVAITDVMPTDSTKCSFCHNLEQLRTLGQTHQTKNVSVFLDCLSCHDGFSAKIMASVDSLHWNGILDTLPGSSSP